MQIVIRRAEQRDVPGIQLLTKEEVVAQSLKKRFGALNSIATLVDISPLSLVATDVQDTAIIGFCAFSNGPPPFVDFIIEKQEDATVSQRNSQSKFGTISKGNWEMWMRERYDCRDISIQNAKFLSYFVALPDNQIAFLDASLSTLFGLLPTVKHVCYFLPDIITLFAPLSSQKFIPQPPTPPPEEEDPAEQSSPHSSTHHLGLKKLKRKVKSMAMLMTLFRKPHGSGPGMQHLGDDRPVYFSEVQAKTGIAFAPFALQVCSKKDVFPTVKIRKGRVEDCDDLVPMFKKQNLLNGQNADHFLAELLESKNDAVKTLVAEIGGLVAGFMSLTNEVDQDLLAKTFDLDAFDNLIKDVPPDMLSTANGDHIKPISLGDGVTFMDPVALAATHLSLQTADPIRAALEANTAEGRAAAKAASLIAAQQAAIEEAKLLQLQCNVFCINLLCIEDAHANQGIEFVKAAFTLFPDRDYCVVTVPTGMPEIPMLRNFTMAQPRYGKMTSHCLYILNRFGCTEPVSVRPAQSTDFATVEQIVDGLAAQDEILVRFADSFKESESGIPKYKAFTADSGGQAIGVAILKKLTFASTISDQFDIEQFINLKITSLDEEHVVLRHLILNPLFSHQANWFLEEVMRMAGVGCLLYPIDESSRLDVSTRMLMGKELVPVKRRRQIMYSDGLRDGITVSQDLPFNLQITTSSLLYEPKITINSRIVVVGGSDTGIAFLEKLVYTPYLYFSNITLISASGIPSKPHSKSFVDTKCYSGIELKQLGLDHYVRVIRASTTEFDRVLKRVRLDNDAFITYDFLFLTPGVQFFASNISEEFESIGGVFNLSPRSYESYMKAVARFSGRDVSQTGRIMIYGRDLQVFVTVQESNVGITEILQHGIHPSWVIVVFPPLTTPSSCFDNQTVEDKMMQVLSHLGVQVLRDFKVTLWETSPSLLLTSITLTNKSDNTEQKFDQVEVFLYADSKSVDPDTFMSINDSCLVFDGLLVIDKYFRTQDPYIYAAGSITKYSSRYQTKWKHGFYDSKEVGVKLAETVMSFFDPIQLPQPLDDDETLLKFTESKKVYALLPGGLYYLHFDEPRLPSHTLEFMQKLPNYGRDLVINNDQYGYFRIRVDPHGFIRSLTYLGKREIPVDNYLCLYGLNERYLNRLSARFDEGVIADFVSFLSEAWAYPIFHDRFPSFIKDLREDMLKHDGDGIVDLVGRIKEIGREGEPIPELERDDLVKRFQASEERKVWDSQLFEFYLGSKVCASYP
ncbi:hypothetical protein CcCBS67573_g03643 [Chytriomyces confervae]|uniref:Uncharacterized protein n=1 Tax=Chytriomyces confervae TaxID=246404 RepID=A0A507FHH0_9FUNG|nr:hypothetical protein CcCBS67573_g03643 [Chytriomyces confervae]